MELGSVCIGVYFLVVMGLLDNKEVFLYWVWIDEFKLMYLKVKWVFECIIMDMDGLYILGGIFFFLILFYIWLKSLLVRKLLFVF